MYLMASNKSKKALVDRTSRIVKSLVDSPELEELTDEQMNKIAGAVLAETLKDKLKAEVKKSKINVDNLINEWLKKFNSDETKRSFRRNLEYFLNWLGSDKSIFDVTSRIVDDYIVFLKTTKPEKADNGSKISNNTIRQRVAACSSFWKSLKRWGIVDINPWLGCSLPKKTIAIKESEKVPMDKELDTIENFCLSEIQAESGKGFINKIRGAKKALVALKILRATGLRVGALPTLLIDRDGNYKAQSKGGVAYGKFDEDILNIIADLGLDGKQPFRDYNSFSKWFNRTCKKLNYKFSVHGIRHRFAVNYYNRTKDVVGLQRTLGHSSLIATQAYLATLKCGLNDFRDEYNN